MPEVSLLGVSFTARWRPGVFGFARWKPVQWSLWLVASLAWPSSTCNLVGPSESPRRPAFACARHAYAVAKPFHRADVPKAAPHPLARLSCRTLDPMSEMPVSVEPEGDECETRCSCCGRPVYWGHGWLMSDGRSLAAFWYQWSEGHQGRFCLAVARFNDEERLIPGVVCMSAEIRDEALRYGVSEPEQAPWPDFGAFGAVATREHALHDREWVFALVDAITTNDRRLSSRILASRLHS